MLAVDFNPRRRARRVSQTCHLPCPSAHIAPWVKNPRLTIEKPLRCWGHVSLGLAYMSLYGGRACFCKLKPRANIKGAATRLYVYVHTPKLVVHTAYYA